MTKKEPVLEDIELESIVLRMSFGKHKGRPVAEVPASYLLFCFEQEWLPKVSPDLYDYIEANYEDLRERAEEEDDYDATESDLY